MCIAITRKRCKGGIRGWLNGKCCLRAASPAFLRCAVRRAAEHRQTWIVGRSCKSTSILVNETRMVSTKKKKVQTVGAKGHVDTVEPFVRISRQLVEHSCRSRGTFLTTMSGLRKGSVPSLSPSLGYSASAVDDSTRPRQSSNLPTRW